MALSRRLKFGLIALAVLGALIAAGVWVAGRLLQPERLTALVLDRAETALGLQLSVAAPADYALRPEPRLVLTGLSARMPGDANPLLRAARVQLALPWATLTDRDAGVVVTRIVLDAPELDLAALRRWQATRPDSAAALATPTLTDGLDIDAGRILGEGWTLTDIALALPALAQDTATTLTASGVFERGTLRAPFDAALTTTPRVRGEQIVLDALALRFSSDTAQSPSPMPSLTAAGQLGFGRSYDLALAGELLRWPASWPALPEPLASSTSPLPFTLGYARALDFSEPLTMTLARDDARLAARLAIPSIIDWLGADAATPLPPLLGTFNADQLQVGAVTLHGVSITVDEDAPAADASNPDARDAGDVAADDANASTAATSDMRD